MMITKVLRISIMSPFVSVKYYHALQHAETDAPMYPTQAHGYANQARKRGVSIGAEGHLD